MKIILAACVALSVTGFALVSPAIADTTVATPGVTVDNGDAYWRHHNPNSEWRARSEFRERQYESEAWLRAHCVRGWSGGEYCRR